MRRAAPLLLALLLAAACRAPGRRWPGLPAHTAGALHVIVFDIGQADAMLVLHRGRAMLIDAGATVSRRDRDKFRDIGRRLEALTGRRHLDYFVVSHYHADHVGRPPRGHGPGRLALGLWGLLADEGVTVDTLVDRGFMTLGPPGPTQRNYQAAVPRWLASGKVRRRLKVRPHDLLDMGPGLKVEVVAADGNGRLFEIRKQHPGLLERFPPSENDYSVVLKLTLGDFELVTGGDLSGRDVTRAFGRDARVSYNDIESVVAGDIGDVEVYRVNHHGSRNSTNACFARVLHPEVSIISSGRNHFGHPAPRVYDLLKASGAVYIVSGADPEVYRSVAADIVEDDVEVIVAPAGDRYWVNGRPFRALGEAAERRRPGRAERCRPVRRKRDPNRPEEWGPVDLD